MEDGRKETLNEFVINRWSRFALIFFLGISIVLYSLGFVSDVLLDLSWASMAMYAAVTLLIFIPIVRLLACAWFFLKSTDPRYAVLSITLILMIALSVLVASIL